MTWQLTGDVEEFQRVAGPYLAADPVGTTALITVSETVRRHGPSVYGAGGPPPRFGWWREDPSAPVEAAFVQTPPHAPMFGSIDPEHARSLSRVLRAAGDEVPVSGVKGADGGAQAFADAWAGPGSWSVVVRLRLFRLGELTPPEPPGRARRACAGDVSLVAAWMRGFAADIGGDADADQTANAARRIADGCLWLWEVEGRPVSMASRSPVLVGQSRVSPVYTPDGFRGRGYAGAVTAAVSRAAVADGAELVLLFADTDNPTSSALYQRLGYRPVQDHVDLAFT
ncbi:GNAT family N-acetyltransferase [Streptomyces sp. NPDC008141]|uniref:GNAT family N-acetyltransferase n=1 Tax=Streptomyces sp. NPDC008141 TaxID=3364815 RepID=UPI0036F12375